LLFTSEDFERNVVAEQIIYSVHENENKIFSVFFYLLWNVNPKTMQIWLVRKGRSTWGYWVFI